jgi:hypothetical protein
LHGEIHAGDRNISILTIESAVSGSPKSDGTGLDDRTLSAIVVKLEVVLKPSEDTIEPAVTELSRDVRASYE